MMNENAFKNRKILIAIIDSGIDCNNLDLKDYVEFSTGFRMDENLNIVEDKSTEVNHEHGTIIALIIKQLCNNAKFISINILNKNLKSNGTILIHSLYKALELKPDIIHLSLGTLKFRYIIPLFKILKIANRRNICIVAAADNYGHISYPAYLRNVIGVKGIFTNNYKYFQYKKGFFYAPFNTEYITGIDKLENKNMCGNSMAAAYITGHLSNIKYQNFNISNLEVIKKLKLGAKN